MAAAATDLKKDSAGQIQENLLAGKYKTAEELVAAYTELEKKLGQMGTETAAQRAELERVQAQAVEYQKGHEWAQQYGQQLVQQTQLQAQQLAQLQAQRQNGATQQPGTDPLAWLRPEERTALYQEFARQYHQQGLLPFVKQYAEQQVVPYIAQQMKVVQDQLAAQQRAALELTWSAIEHIAPEDRLASVKDRQARMLKYSDPKAYDPRKFADEDVARELEITKSKDKIAELEKQLAERQRQDVLPTSTSGGVSPFKADKDRAAAPKNREERLRTVVEQVREQQGPEQFRQAFPVTP